LNGKIGYVNLTTGKISQNVIPKTMRTRYLGGRGINMYLLYNHLMPQTDPLSSDNILLIGAGLLGGIPCLGSGRCDIAAKSPLTGAIGDSNIGGFFAPELRLAGFDHLAITGKAEKPVYLLVENNTITVKDASHLWGQDTFDSQTILRKEEDDENIKSLVIGWKNRHGMCDGLEEAEGSCHQRNYPTQIYSSRQAS
jgi:aldehyde:ferredoxin oxidoreductase